jgi:hypothetical protein
MAYALALGVAAAIVGVVLYAVHAGFKSAGAPMAGTVVVTGLATVGYLIALLGFGVIKRLVLDRGLWALVAGSITLTGLHALEQVKAEGAPAGSLGEGLADALDVGAF